VRYKDDAQWPKPIWGQQAATPYSPEALSALKAK
jgi:diadenosine tetraphosphate (Ap4A) HIT family hydrolase